MSVTSFDTGPAFSRRLADAFLREEKSGLGFAMWVRISALTAIACWLLYIVPMPRVLYWLGIIALFLVLSAAPLIARAQSRHWRVWTALFVLLDVALLVFVLLFPNPMLVSDWPIQTQLRLSNFLYLMVFVGGAALSYSPGIVVWTGICAAASWAAGVSLIIARPESFTVLEAGSATVETESLGSLGRFLDPFFVSMPRLYNEVVLLLIMTAIIAAAVWRARRLVLRHAAAERAQTNLARYFSPNLVDRLANDENTLDRPETRDVAVLFVDIVGFTGVSENKDPERVIALLRSFHRRMADCVFRHDGILDKYIGDSVMATFGSVPGEPDEATRALRCAGDMLDQVKRWNAKRESRGAEGLRVGIGLHYGPVVVGNVGDDRCLEFTVIGDTVNVASRLERQTRAMGAPLVVSEDLIGAVRREGRVPAESLARFDQQANVSLPGRSAEVAVWSYDDRDNRFSDASLSDSAPTEAH